MRICQLTKLPHPQRAATFRAMPKSLPGTRRGEPNPTFAKTRQTWAPPRNFQPSGWPSFALFAKLGNQAVQICRLLSKTLRSEEHTSELQSPDHIVCLLLLTKQY